MTYLIGGTRMKIKNTKLINTTASFEVGSFKFDNEGVANIVPDEFAEILLGIPNFTKFGITEEASKEVEVEVELGGKTEVVEVDEKDLEDAIKESARANEDMSHKELDAIADELIAEGLLIEKIYPRKKTIKDKVDAINSVK